MQPVEILLIGTHTYRQLLTKIHVFNLSSISFYRPLAGQVFDRLRGNFVSLSQLKFSSNVVERCLQFTGKSVFPRQTIASFL
jgi:hypothetical protein